MDYAKPVLIRNARIYAPESLGRRDLLIQGGQVGTMGSDLGRLPSWLPHEDVDFEGLLVVPGFITRMFI
jgi:beta-aspartyl-dipeptidase (metallo-type)